MVNAMISQKFSNANDHSTVSHRDSFHTDYCITFHYLPTTRWEHFISTSLGDWVLHIIVLCVGVSVVICVCVLRESHD